MELYRADTRTPEELINAGGFKAWTYPNKTEHDMRRTAIETVEEMYKASGNKSELMSHIWGTPDKRFISTALTADCMGQANKKNYRFDQVLFKRVEEYSKVYRIDIPNLQAYQFDNGHLGFTPRNIPPVLTPKLYMDANRLDLVKWVGHRVGSTSGQGSNFRHDDTVAFYKGVQRAWW
jgi:hypothetical protein